MNRSLMIVFRRFLDYFDFTVGSGISSPFRACQSKTSLPPGNRTESVSKFDGFPSTSTADCHQFNLLKNRRHFGIAPEFTGLGGEIDRLRGYVRVRISLWMGETPTEDDCCQCRA
ncbi:hypothetical protein K2Y11_19590 [bacterium]|nr:hypothetical protein [bacterium]